MSKNISPIHSQSLIVSNEVTFNDKTDTIIKEIFYAFDKTHSKSTARDLCWKLRPKKSFIKNMPSIELFHALARQENLKEKVNKLATYIWVYISSLEPKKNFTKILRKKFHTLTSKEKEQLTTWFTKSKQLAFDTLTSKEKEQLKIRFSKNKQSQSQNVITIVNTIDNYFANSTYENFLECLYSLSSLNSLMKIQDK